MQAWNGHSVPKVKLSVQILRYHLLLVFLVEVLVVAVEVCFCWIPQRFKVPFCQAVLCSNSGVLSDPLTHVPRNARWIWLVWRPRVASSLTLAKISEMDSTMISPFIAKGISAVVTMWLQGKASISIIF